MKPKLSVAVCTFNRAALLTKVLDSLSKQTLDPAVFEILIIDNNSIDDTANVAQEFCLANSNARYCLEHQQGLSYARNRAWKESSAKYIAYIDDDAIADPEWCERMASAFEQIQPSPLAVGGIISPWYQTQKPGWFSDSFEVRSWGREPHFLNEDHAKFGFSGSNMAIERGLLERLAGFSPELGMKGESLGLGEEADFFLRAWKLEPGRFWYDPAIAVRHLVSTKNMRLRYQLRRMYISGRTGASITNEWPNGWNHLRQMVMPLRIALEAPVKALKSDQAFRAALVSEARRCMYAVGWAVHRTPLVMRQVLLKRRMRLDAFLAHIVRPLRRHNETRKYRKVAVAPDTTFHIVSCGRNTGMAILKCLDSVYSQEFDRAKIKHYLIDDASDDGTIDIIEEWLRSHPGHSVELFKNRERIGGTANTQVAFRAAESSAIVIELNADDWLADDKVLAFLSKVYRNPYTWMTYNSFVYSSGSPSERRRPYPKYVIRKSSYRDYEWICQHLHSFRAALLAHLPEEVFLDPETGDYFSKADDRSIYWSLLEICGPHAIHLERPMYVYNFHENTDLILDPDGSFENVIKIAKMKRFSQLSSLRTMS